MEQSTTIHQCDREGISFTSSKATDDELREVYIGWPEDGGILVLDDVREAIPWEIVMLRLATTMEERCNLLRDKLGATYYKDPRTYPGFAVLGPRKIGD